MNIGIALSWVFQALDSLFETFRGIFFSLGFDIVAFIVTCFGILCVLRMVTNGTLSLSKTVDIPKDPNPQYNQRYRSDQDPWNPVRQYSIFDNDDISKE